MLCVLAFVGFGHAFTNSGGNVLFKYCYYDCGSTSNGLWYDRVYRVNAFELCPKEFKET